MLLMSKLACGGEPPDRVHVPPDVYSTLQVNGLELAHFEHGTAPLVLMVTDDFVTELLAILGDPA